MVKVATINSSKPISAKMWFAAFLVSLQSFNLGYVLVALNSCLVLGSNKNSNTACYNHDDDGNYACPKGTIYNDLNLNTSMLAYHNYVTCCNNLFT